MNNTHTLPEFLQYLPGQKEVALVISHDSKELGSFTELLEAQGFVPAYSVIELLNAVEGGINSYLLADGSSASAAKDIYDLSVQYPTGQVQIWDAGKNCMTSISPSYRSSTPVLITTTQNLKALEGQGFDLRHQSGLAYQTNV